MLKGRGYTYFPKKQFIRITGLPPQGWDDLTRDEQFQAFEDLMGLDVPIMSSQFDY